MMKYFIRNLIYAKAAAGLLSSFYLYRKKTTALGQIENSGFYQLVKKIKNHPKTRRTDGFYKVVFEFDSRLADDSFVQARVKSYRPVEKISSKDSLEIAVGVGKDEFKISQVVVRKPVFSGERLPALVNRNILGILKIESKNQIKDIEKSYKLLDQALSTS